MLGSPSIRAKSVVMERTRSNFDVASLLVALLCGALSVIWALRVPVFESPDEAAHADYAFALYDVGRPFVVRNAIAHTFATPQTRYLADAIGYREMRYNPTARAPSGYGTSAYFRALDRAAPQPRNRVPAHGSTMPYVMFAYPIGYYAILATVMEAAGKLSRGSLSAEFFIGRFSSALFLTFTLLIVYRIFRILSFSRAVALAASLALGSFPLVTVVSSAIQPDNLALLVSTAILYYALRFQREPIGSHALALGLLCSVMFFVKQHNALAFWLPSLFLVTTLWWRKRRSLAIATTYLVALPVLAFAGSFVLTPVRELRDPQRFVQNTIAHSAASSGPALVEFAAGILRGIVSLYGGGTAFSSFWLQFGFRGATYVPEATSHSLASVLLGVTIIVSIVALATHLRVLRRILTVYRKRSPYRAACLIAADIPKNTYAFVLAALLMIYVGTAITLQGRYMLVALVPLSIVLLRDLPRLFKQRYRERLRLGIAVSFAAYSVVLSIFALRAMNENYYAPVRQPLTTDILADVDSVIANERDVPIGSNMLVVRNSDVTFSGHAIDMRTGLPAERVVLTIDGRRARVIGRTGLERIDVAAIFADERLDRSGFSLTVPARSLHPGINRIDLRAMRNSETQGLAFTRPFTLRVR